MMSVVPDSNMINDDKPHEECGVFGIFDHADAAPLTVLGLHALQHRGQEAAGIVAFDGKHFNSERRLGLVGDNFSSERTMARLKGSAAIGHVRYSTTGDNVLRNVQPLFSDLSTGGIAVAHNGNLTNGVALRRDLVRRGCLFQSTSDTETILHLIARSDKRQIIDRFVDALGHLEGAYSLVALTNKKLIGARDPLGIRPLVLGELDGGMILASETCALDIIGAKFVRDINPGEVVIITKDGIKSLTPFPPKPSRLDIFEYIYFARPDSVVNGLSVYDVRKSLGAELAKEFPANADVVVPVPDGGVPAAIGYANQTNLPFELGIIRNHYVGRTFIEPTQGIRALGVKLKHNANRSQIEGRSVVLVDDSIVRGTTAMKIVEMVRDAGAREIHLRVSSPPIRYPCFYGIDMPDRDELLAANNSLEEMRQKFGVDTLQFLSIDGLYRAMGLSGRDNAAPQFTDHAFTGDYPTPLTDQEENDGSNVHQLSFLAENV